MANEPERPIEKLLRAAAQKRRDEAGAPFELHPATRRLLQGEVSRQFAKPGRQRRSSPSFLAQFWPRLAWSVAILAVLGVTVWTVMQMQANDKQAALLAKMDEVQQARRLSAPFPSAPAGPAEATPPPVTTSPESPAPMAYAEKTAPKPNVGVVRPPARSQFLAKDKHPPAVTLESAERATVAQRPAVFSSVSGAPRPTEPANETFQRQHALAATPAPAAAASVPIAAPPPAAVHVAAADKSTSLGLEESKAAGPAYRSLTAPASTASARPSTAAMDSQAKASRRALKEAPTARTAQRFVQMALEGGTKAAVADKAKTAQAVLAAFDVEQDGRQLRITDHDGSVYTGYLQAAPTFQRTHPFKGGLPAPATAGGTPHAAFEQKAQFGFDADQLAQYYYFFHVTGTNRSLHKEVVFTGNFLAATNLTRLPPARTNFALGGRLAGASADLPAPAALPLLRSRITGKVIVGSGKPLEVNALPAAP